MHAHLRLHRQLYQLGGFLTLWPEGPAVPTDSQHFYLGYSCPTLNQTSLCFAKLTKSVTKPADARLGPTKPISQSLFSKFTICQNLCIENISRFNSKPSVFGPYLIIISSQLSKKCNILADASLQGKFQFSNFLPKQTSQLSSENPVSRERQRDT